MSDKEQTQQLIALANNCFLCPEADFTTPQNLRKHLMNVHQLQLPGRPMGVKHRDTADIVYLAISNLMNSKFHHCPLKPCRNFLFVADG
ncbi:hypothetical protein AB4K20DRAFT_1908056 [Rhizopus microsporus]